jgi:hypothetical protein
LLLKDLDLQYSDNLFDFTRGRFVVDEAFEMSQRYVQFNVNELARVAAEVVGPNNCVSVEKYSDGMYNKAMLLTMDNGTQVVAKVPNPDTGKPYFTIASEVATIGFVSSLLYLLLLTNTNPLRVRNVLKTPVPRVFACSPKAPENPVCAEYIIMEKLPGTELGDCGIR